MTASDVESRWVGFLPEVVALTLLAFSALKSAMFHDLIVAVLTLGVAVLLSIESRTMLAGPGVVAAATERVRPGDSLELCFPQSGLWRPVSVTHELASGPALVQGDVAQLRLERRGTIQSVHVTYVSVGTSGVTTLVKSSDVVLRRKVLVLPHSRPTVHTAIVVASVATGATRIVQVGEPARIDWTRTATSGRFIGLPPRRSVEFYVPDLQSPTREAGIAEICSQVPVELRRGSEVWIRDSTEASRLVTHSSYEQFVCDLPSTAEPLAALDTRTSRLSIFSGVVERRQYLVTAAVLIPSLPVAHLVRLVAVSGLMAAFIVRKRPITTSVRQPRRRPLLQATMCAVLLLTALFVAGASNSRFRLNGLPTNMVSDGLDRLALADGSPSPSITLSLISLTLASTWLLSRRKPDRSSRDDNDALTAYARDMGVVNLCPADTVTSTVTKLGSLIEADLSEMGVLLNSRRYSNLPFDWPEAVKEEIRRAGLRR